MQLHRINICDKVTINSWKISGNSVGADSSIGNISNHSLSLITNNAPRITVSADGNVGIGTATPQALLDLASTTSGLSAIIVPRDTAANRPPTGVNGMIRFNSTTNKFEAYQGLWQEMISSGGATSTGNSGALQFSNGSGSFLSNNNIVIDGTNGRIGVGTSSPSVPLEVTGNARVNGWIDVGTVYGPTSPITIFQGNTNWTHGLTMATKGSGTANMTGIALLTQSNLDTTTFNDANTGGWALNAYGWNYSPSYLGSVLEFQFNSGVTRSTAFALTPSGKVGIGTLTPLALLDLATTTSGHSAIIVPRDTAANRPPTGVNGMIRYNTNTSKFEAYENNAWVNMTASGAGVSSSGNSSALQYSNGAGGFLSNNNIVVDGTNGRLGVGLTNPQDTLDIKGDMRIRGNGVTTASIRAAQNGTGDSDGRLNIYGNTSGSDGSLISLYGNNYTGRTGEIDFMSGTGGDIVFTNYDGAMFPRYMTIQYGGNVGIGTAGPLAVLDVSSTTSGKSAIIVPRDTTANRPPSGVNGMIRYNTNTNKIEAYQNGGWTNMVSSVASTGNAGAVQYADGSGSFVSNNNFVVDSNGNVGIGIATPGYKLDVNGTVSIRGTSPAISMGSGNIEIRTPSTSELKFYDNARGGGPSLTVNTWAGQLGINGDPTTNLDVNDPSGDSKTTLGNDSNSGSTSALYFSRSSTEKTGIISVATGAWDRNDLHFVVRTASDGNPASIPADTRLFISSANGNVGVGTSSPEAILDVSTTTSGHSAVIVPRDTTANRPPTGVNGMIRYNTNNNVFEGFGNGTWGPLASSGAPTFPLLATPTGSASAAAYSFFGDGNTGMYSPAADNLAFATSGSQRLSIDSAGGVGVGSTSSIYMTNSGFMGFGNTNPSYPIDIVHNTGGGRAMSITHNGGGLSSVRVVSTVTSGASGIYLSQNGTNVMGMNIEGTTNTVTLLDLMGTSGQSVDMFRVGKSAAGDVFTINSVGSIGVGTPSPRAVLDFGSSVAGQSAIILPRDTTSNRPTAVNGMIRYNTDTSAIEGYVNGAWSTMGGGGAASQWSNGVASSIYYTAGSVGIGVTSPAAFLNVVNTANGGNTFNFEGYAGSKFTLSHSNFEMVTEPSANGRGLGLTAAGTAGSPYFLMGDADSSAKFNFISNGSGAGYLNLTVSNYPVAKFIKGDNRTGNMVLSGLAGDATYNNAALLVRNRWEGDPALLAAKLNSSTTADIFQVTDESLSPFMNVTALGKVGIGTPTPQALLDLSTTTSGLSAIIVPRDTTANRPPTGVNGMLRYNTNTNAFESYANGAWGALGSSPSGNSGAIQVSNGAGALTSNNNIKIDTTTGRLGVGTANPSGLMSVVYGTVGGPGHISMNVLPLDGSGDSYNTGISVLANQSKFILTSEEGVNRPAMVFSDGSGADTMFGLSASDDTGTTYNSRFAVQFNGKVGIGTKSPRAILEVTALGTNSAVIVPRETTANRPPTGVNGMFRYNTNTSNFEGYSNGSWSSVGSARRTCMIVIGADNGTALGSADIAPQGQQCYIPMNATVIEISVRADNGTPAVALQRRRGGSVADLMSAELATAASGGAACAMTSTSQTCIDGTTSSGSITLSNTSLSPGDWIETKTATAGGTAKRMSIAIVYTVN